MTRKLYEETPAPLAFTARVTGCEPDQKGYRVTLDATGFFPEGGGQPWDLGTLNGIPVTAVVVQGEEIYHLLPQPLEPGTPVEGIIDGERRLDHCQQHTGEHILSGTLHRLFGANNVGFHIGQPYVRMDLDLPLTTEQLAQAEAQANTVIRQDFPVKVWYPDPEELEALEYRSKKALEGPVRLVEIPGADRCACCGTHLERTGMVGIIKIISAQNYKGGVRLEVACGGRAIPPIQDWYRQITALSGLLSAKVPAVEQAARRMAGDHQELTGQLAQLSALLIVAQARDALPGPGPVRFCEGRNPDGAAAALPGPGPEIRGPLRRLRCRRPGHSLRPGPARWGCAAPGGGAEPAVFRPGRRHPQSLPGLPDPGHSPGHQRIYGGIIPCGCDLSPMPGRNCWPATTTNIPPWK